jgi:DnaJ-class molecular chaperone
MLVCIYKDIETTHTPEDEMRPTHLTHAERSLAHLVTDFAMGTDMHAGIARILAKNAAKLNDEPETITCRECDGHGWLREDYAGLGRFVRTDCDTCNGEGTVPNRLTITR